MTEIVLIRHGPTEWNAAGRVQGRTDVPLSAAGCARVRHWRVPPDLCGHDWVSSPLRRARETAVLLGADEPVIEPRLAEMCWGAWEGETLDALRIRYGAALIENESRGLDFRAPDGESPREVGVRVLAWLAERAQHSRPTIGVTHKGVVRATLALATGWDMMGKAPVSLDWDSCHVFTIDQSGTPHVLRLNVSLVSDRGGRA
jgi:probable phosphoglycerate mutase